MCEETREYSAPSDSRFSKPSAAIQQRGAVGQWSRGGAARRAWRRDGAGGARIPQSVACCARRGARLYSSGGERCGTQRLKTRRSSVPLNEYTLSASRM
eukprot:3775222-Prymnesium_polylepis.1